MLKEVETLAARMKSLGYATYQVTANVATTRIFGLHEGFDEVIRICLEEHVPIYQGRIDKTLFLASVEEQSAVSVAA